MIAQLDESVPARLAKDLDAAGVRTLRFPSDWKGLKNGELLLRLRESGVSSLITCDKNLRYQQTIARSKLSLVVLPRQRYQDLLPYAAVIAKSALGAEAGEIILIDGDGTVSKA